MVIFVKQVDGDFKEAKALETTIIDDISKII